MPRFTKFILFFILVNSLFAQVSTSTRIGLPKGEYELVSVLKFINDLDISLAFSSSKLKGIKTEITAEETIQSLLDRLQREQIIAYEIKNEALFISPFKISNFTVNGIINDIETGEVLIGATIQLENSNLGNITNGYGYFSFTLPEGNHSLLVRYIGFEDKKIELELKQNTYLAIGLSPKVLELKEIEVRSFASDFTFTSTIPSINKISIDPETDNTPYLGGEVDVIQNLLLQPGVNTIGELSNGFNIRGGQADQNLILLDEAPIYRSNHTDGITISVFNPEAINSFTFMKGYIPPAYGGRTSSVLEVRQKEGDINDYHISGEVGILSTRALIEGPLTKRNSFLVSGRQSLINLSTDFGSASLRRTRIGFQDLNMKLNFRQNERNTFFISGYYGNDRSRVGISSESNWGNRLLTMRWNHLFSPKVFSNLSAYISEYSYQTEDDGEPGAFIATSTVSNYGLKPSLLISFDPNNEVSMGANITYHDLSPGSRIPIDDEATTNTIQLDNEDGIESALYVNHVFKKGKFSLNYGLRYSMLHYLGPGTVSIYKDDSYDSAVIDTLFYENYELIKKYELPEPRMAISYLIGDKLSVKGAFSRTSQFIHLISNTVTPSPTDIWKLSDSYIDPTISDHYSLGIYKKFGNGSWTGVVEAYYKDIQNSIRYKDGADLIFNENLETEILINDSRAYGLEFFLQKHSGKLRGWISYTWSRAEYLFDPNANDPEYILENYDKPHSFSTTWSYELSDRVNLSANFVFTTGSPITLPTDKVIFEGNLVPYFTERNNARLPNYHRLDTSIKVEGKKFKKDGSPRKNRDFLILTVYNAYGRQNAYSYSFRASEENPSVGEVVQNSIFGFVFPALTYNFHF